MYTFLRHYIEMVIVMFLGMGVVMAVAGMPSDDTLALLYMGASMTVPMVAWMLVRGHGWRPSLEMAAAMLLPTAVAASLVGTVDYGALMGVEHVAMLLGMLGAMLYRRDEYAHGHHRVA
jgi:flagellar biosynthetic protein FliP